MNIFYSHTVFSVNHAVCLCGEGDLWCVREAQRLCKSLVHLQIYLHLNHLPSQLISHNGPDRVYYNDKNDVFNGEKKKWNKIKYNILVQSWKLIGFRSLPSATLSQE